jgi:hypothetical protein
MLEPVLDYSLTDDWVLRKLLLKVEGVRKSVSLTGAQWEIIDPLLTQLTKACHRRLRGDA